MKPELKMIAEMKRREETRKAQCLVVSKFINSVTHVRIFEVWTLDGVTFHFTFAPRDKRLMEDAIDKAVKLAGGTRYASLSHQLSRVVRGSHYTCPVVIENLAKLTLSGSPRNDATEERAL